MRFLTPSEEAQRVEYVRCLGSAPDMSVDRPLCEVTFGDMRIEDLPGAMCHVNFANKKLALGIIPSCTQEEILFCFRPEMYVAILVVETLRDDESVVFRGCHRMVQYSGYLGTFQFEGDFVEAPNVAEVVAIDALVNFGGLESTMGGLVRDVTKAYIGFSASSEVVANVVRSPSGGLATKSRTLADGAERPVPASVAAGIRPAASPVANAEVAPYVAAFEASDAAAPKADPALPAAYFRSFSATR